MLLVIHLYRIAQVFIYALVEKVKTHLLMDILLRMYHVAEQVGIMEGAKEEMQQKMHMDHFLHIYVVVVVEEVPHI